MYGGNTKIIAIPIYRVATTVPCDNECTKGISSYTFVGVYNVYSKQVFQSLIKMEGALLYK